MQSLHPWFETNPILIGVVAFAAIFTLLMLVLAVLMRRAGVSLKPLVFFTIFMAIVAGPQAAYHLLNLKSPDAKSAAPTASTTSTPSTTSTASTLPDPTIFATTNGRFTNPQAVFGPDADPALIVPIKESLAMIFANAKAAEMSASLEGTTFAAIFPDHESALDAQNRFVQTMAVANAIGDDAQGYIGDKQFSGERVQFIAAGPVFMAWTGQNDEALAAKRALLSTALALSTPSTKSTKSTMSTKSTTSTMSTMSTPSTPSTTEASFIVDDIPFNNIWLALAFLAINVLAAIVWFFKGSAWATKTSPKPGAQPIRAIELRNRLLAINQTDTPVEVTDNGDTIDITWRYADARWLDHAKAHGMRRIHKLSLDLSEDDHTVRVREFMSAVDWSAGVDAASIQWRAAIGIQFFHYEHQRVFGLQIAPDGSLKTNLSYSYTFNLQELKEPFVQAVTRAGWTWRPVFFNAPKSLRWLTE